MYNLIHVLKCEVKSQDILLRALTRKRRKHEGTLQSVAEEEEKTKLPVQEPPSAPRHSYHHIMWR